MQRWMSWLSVVLPSLYWRRRRWLAGKIQSLSHAGEASALFNSKGRFDWCSCNLLVIKIQTTFVNKISDEHRRYLLTWVHEFYYVNPGGTVALQLDILYGNPAKQTWLEVSSLLKILLSGCVYCAHWINTSTKSIYSQKLKRTYVIIEWKAETTFFPISLSCLATN